MPGGGCVKRDKKIRIRAVVLHLTHDSDSKVAGEHLQAELRSRGEAPLARPAEFVGKWANSFLTEGHVLDAPRSGRPGLQLTPTAAAAAVAAFKRGLGTGHRADGFTSIEEACVLCPELAALRERSPPPPGEEVGACWVVPAAGRCRTHAQCSHTPLPLLTATAS
jgi:hypothetical protein